MNREKDTIELPRPEISIVIPVMDEEANIAPLSGEIREVMDAASWAWECIWVNDGSADHTESALKELNAADGRHKFLNLARNFGQSAALYAGFRKARGEIIVTLDGDGQNDPRDIPLLINRLIDENADMVNGWRRGRRDHPVRKISSLIANGFRNRLTGDRVRDVGCSLRAFRRACVADIPLFKGMHRFMPTLVRMEGFTRMIEIPVSHRPRKAGKTKYGIHNRLWVGIADTLAVRWMKHRMVRPEIKPPAPKDGGTSR